MGAIIGFVIALGSLLGGFLAMGGKLAVIWQPWEYLIIIGVAAGTFIVANPMSLVKDTGRACVEAISGKVPTRDDYLTILGLLYVLLNQMRAKPRSEIEAHLDAPDESEIFKAFPSVLKDREATLFICDYARLIVIGNARPHEIESLMEHEIDTHRKDRLKPYYALNMVAESLPALGIVAAVLGIVKAMGAINQSPEILGGLIGAALVGTFAGIFISYAIVSPLALKIKSFREKQTRVYVIVKQSLIAYMNGALPQIAIEHGRKGISADNRPSIDEVENATLTGGRVEETKAAA